MYLWPGNQFGPQNQVVVDGPRLLRREPVEIRPGADDCRNVGPIFVYAGNGLHAGLYPPSLPAPRWIAVVDGGTAACTYLLRVQVAQSWARAARSS